MKTIWWQSLFASCLFSFTAVSHAASAAPEFTHTQDNEWINTTPQTWQQLEGKVVLIEFWTFDCRNCYRTIPWLNDLYSRYKNKDFEIISVHTPEFEHEKKRENVLARIKEHNIQYPVMLDNDFSYWKALENQYWPAFYLVDKHGKLRGKTAGETHIGDANAMAIENAIQTLLTE